MGEADVIDKQADTEERLVGLMPHRESLVEAGGVTYCLVGKGLEKRLAVMGEAAGLDGSRQGDLLLCPLSAGNAEVLRQKLPWLRPSRLGLRTSAGLGDRLGLATPGHVRAVRQVGGIAPIFAQQSIRENARTGRTPQQVIDDALWGSFQEGWRQPWGADADHLKTTEDIDLCLAAGYTFFTIDPGDWVDNSAQAAQPAALAPMFEALPWANLADSAGSMRRRYLDRRFGVEDFQLAFDEVTLAQAAAKYGRAIAHTARLYYHLAARSTDFELEMSVDETELPTSVHEHFFISSELRRLGVQWVSLAPRFVGRFEKGVDYIGDLGQFEAELARHAAVARVMGPYKLSLHSGSDKFSVYRLAAEYTRGLVHLKTAGTSYLEALRAVAQVAPALFRQILDYAVERYPQDRATYHVSAELARLPAYETLDAGKLAGLLDQFDARQVLHVTFGSVLACFGAELKAFLHAHEEVYSATLVTHFRRHLLPFA